MRTDTLCVEKICVKHFTWLTLLFDFYDCLGVNFDGTEKIRKMYSAIFKLKIIGKRFISSSAATLKGQIGKWLKRFSAFLELKQQQKPFKVWGRKSLLCLLCFLHIFKWFHCWYSFQFMKLGGCFKEWNLIIWRFSVFFKIRLQFYN